MNSWQAFAPCWCGSAFPAECGRVWSTPRAALDHRGGRAAVTLSFGCGESVSAKGFGAASPPQSWSSPDVYTVRAFLLQQQFRTMAVSLLPLTEASVEGTAVPTELSRLVLTHFSHRPAGVSLKTALQWPASRLLTALLLLKCPVSFLKLLKNPKVRV